MTDGLVPEGFDLEAAKRAKSTTPPSERKQCPGCGSVKLIRHTNRGNQPRDHGNKYTCQNCRAHFDNPVEVSRDA